MKTFPGLRKLLGTIPRVFQKGNATRNPVEPSTMCLFVACVSQDIISSYHHLVVQIMAPSSQHSVSALQALRVCYIAPPDPLSPAASYLAGSCFAILLYSSVSKKLKCGSTLQKGCFSRRSAVGLSCGSLMNVSIAYSQWWTRNLHIEAIQHEGQRYRTDR